MAYHVLKHNENAAPTGKDDGNSIKDNRTQAPNNSNSMFNNNANSVSSVDTNNYSTDGENSNTVLPISGEKTVSESHDSALQFGLQDVAVGRAGTEGDNLDMFAPENLRVPQDFIEEASVEQIHGAIPVRKPGKQEFVRVRPGEEWQLPVATIENEDREVWIVKRAIVALVANEVSNVLLRLAVNRHGVAFLWPLKISKDGKRNPWNDSAMAGANKAITHWVRVKSDQPAGMYRISVAGGEIPEPEWPDLSFQEILQLAFKDRIIADYNHPILKQLRGEL